MNYETRSKELIHHTFGKESDYNWVEDYNWYNNISETDSTSNGKVEAVDHFFPKDLFCLMYNVYYFFPTKLNIDVATNVIIKYFPKKDIKFEKLYNENYVTISFHNLDLPIELNYEQLEEDIWNFVKPQVTEKNIYSLMLLFHFFCNTYHFEDDSADETLSIFKDERMKHFLNKYLPIKHFIIKRFCFTEAEEENALNWFHQSVNIPFEIRLNPKLYSLSEEMKTFYEKCLQCEAELHTKEGNHV